MRDILFRGKRVDNGEWIEGCFLDENNMGIFYDDTEESDCTVHIFSVIPETVGQYTGQKDRNGDKIFEGDILVLGSSIPHVVKFEDGEFVLENTAISIRYADKFKVIGNIHDNPNFVRGE